MCAQLPCVCCRNLFAFILCNLSSRCYSVTSEQWHCVLYVDVNESAQQPRKDYVNNVYGVYLFLVTLRLCVVHCVYASSAHFSRPVNERPNDTTNEQQKYQQKIDWMPIQLLHLYSFLFTLPKYRWADHTTSTAMQRNRKLKCPISTMIMYDWDVNNNKKKKRKQSCDFIV